MLSGPDIIGSGNIYTLGRQNTTQFIIRDQEHMAGDPGALQGSSHARMKVLR
jgi:hypothetical protein